MYACPRDSVVHYVSDLPNPLLVSKYSLQNDGFSSPSLSLQDPRSTDPIPSLLLISEANESFCARHSKKKTWPLPVFEQETEGDKEEEDADEKGSLPDNHVSLYEESDGHHILVALLKDCIAQKDFHTGCNLHIEIVKKGLFESRIFAGNTLVDMYAKCGMLEEAEDVFQSLPFRTVVAWTALLAGYAQYGQGEDALRCFEQMQCENVSPNHVTYLSILKACANLGAADKCREIHLRIADDGLENDTSVGTALVDTYAKCGCLEQAQEVFDKISIRNVVSFGAILSAFVQHGLGAEALKCFEQMQHEGLYPNAVIFISVLKACGSLEAIDMGKQVHTEVVKVGFLEDDLMLANALLDMYAKCRALTEAQDVFNKLRFCDLISWNSLITGHAQHGNGEEAFVFFEEMQNKGFSPDTVTFTGVLKACASLDAASKGQQVHAEALKRGFSGKIVGSAIVEMYSNCGLLAEAQSVFDNLIPKSVVLWNTLISGYVQHGYSEEALKCFDVMQSQGFSPNALTFASILKACTCLRAADKGQEILFQLDEEGLLGLDMVAKTALIDMYAKCGLIDKAREAFDKLSVRDLVSWSALIAGYAEEGRGEEALECYERMQLDGLSPNLVTFVGILKACGSIGAACKGSKIHAEILQNTGVEKDTLVGTSLVDMYGKCGLVVQAKEVFCKLPDRSIISWNALLAGYSQLGESQNVFKLYNEMVGEGLSPSIVTFTIVFNTCSHAGLLDRAQRYFEVMKMSYGLIPTPEHYNCMVDVFGRAGQVETAVTMLKEMPLTVTLTGWHIVLAACQRDDMYCKAFVHLCDIYAAVAVM